MSGVFTKKTQNCEPLQRQPLPAGSYGRRKCAANRSSLHGAGRGRWLQGARDTRVAPGFSLHSALLPLCRPRSVWALAAWRERWLWELCDDRSYGLVTPERSKSVLWPCHPREEQVSFLEVLAKTLEGLQDPFRSHEPIDVAVGRGWPWEEGSVWLGLSHVPIPEAWKQSAPLEPQAGVLQREKGTQRKGDGTSQRVHIHNDNRWC